MKAPAPGSSLAAYEAAAETIRRQLRELDAALLTHDRSCHTGHDWAAVGDLQHVSSDLAEAIRFLRSGGS